MELSQKKKTKSESDFPVSSFIYSEFGNAYRNKQGEPRFNRNDFRFTNQADIFRMEKKNVGVYRSAFSYNLTDPYESDVFGSFYMDFDKAGDIQAAREDALFVIWKMQLRTSFNLPAEAFRIYFSGKKGFHVVIPWKYMGVFPSPFLHEYYRLIAEDLRSGDSELDTLDMSVYEKRRLFRLENSQHQETGLYKIPLTLGQLSSLSVEQIERLAKQNFLIKYPKPIMQPKAHDKFMEYIKRYEEGLERKYRPYHPEPLGYVPESIQDLMDNGPIEGQRNNTMAVLTAFWRDEGLEYNEVYDTIKGWAYPDLSGPNRISESEIKATVRSLYYSNKHYSRKTVEQYAKEANDYIESIVGKQNKEE